MSQACTHCLTDIKCLLAKLCTKQKDTCCSARVFAWHAMMMLNLPAYHLCLWEVDISSCLNQAADIFYAVNIHSIEQCIYALQQYKRLRQGHPGKQHTICVQMHSSCHCSYMLIDDVTSPLIETVLPCPKWYVRAIRSTPANCDCDLRWR